MKKYLRSQKWIKKKHTISLFIKKNKIEIKIEIWSEICESKGWGFFSRIYNSIINTYFKNIFQLIINIPLR